MNASTTDIASHVVISPGDINSYRVKEYEKYRTQVLQIFLKIKTPCLGRHDAAYIQFLLQYWPSKSFKVN